MSRFALTDEQWSQLEPLLPPRKTRGRPPKDSRLILDALVWLARTGAPWRDLPRDQFGPWSTVSSRFYEWRDAGVLPHVLSELQRLSDAQGAFDWNLHFVDASVVRAHQHAAGAAHTTPEAEALGYSQGGFSTKIHVRAEGQGLPVTFVLTPGERHETTAFEPLMEQGKVKRRGRGRPKLRPKRVAGDKAYSSGAIRGYLRKRKVGAVIARRKDEKQQKEFDRKAYRERNRVERLINRMKQFRRIATRYEKLASSYLAMLTLVAILLWL